MSIYKRNRKNIVNRGSSCIDVLGMTGKIRRGEYISAVRKDERH